MARESVLVQMAMHPYARIADDLRSRIDSGKLAPGAKVPSTRALARRWKVAEATAARALRQLVQEGVLRTAPRSGTSVAGPSKPESSGELSRARIVAEAMRVADGEGLTALTLRGLAARLDAPVMSLYRHLHSKEELVELMADAALSELPLPVKVPKGWRAQLELGSRLEWQMLRRHPWLVRVLNISRPTATPAAMAFVDWVLRALEPTALDEPSKLRLHVTLHSFVQGLAVNVEAEAQATGETGRTEAEHMSAQEAQFAAVAASGRYPHFARMMQGIGASFEIETDALFELGLAAMLDGFAPAIEGKRRRGSRAQSSST